MSDQAFLTTIERAADAAYELYQWQRALYFRPWYEDRRVVEVGCGDGRRIAYAANFASVATGVTSSVQRCAERYPHTRFHAEVPELADIWLAFDALDLVDDPKAWLAEFTERPGMVVVAAANKNAPNEATHPLPELAGRFDAKAFEALVEKTTDRPVTFLSQLATWPGRIVEGLQKDAIAFLAVIGDELALPEWPRIGLSMPTCNGAARVRDAVLGFTKFYPGVVDFAIVANGTDDENLASLRELEELLPETVTVIHHEKNLGYGRGCNAGLDHLWQTGWYDLFGVTNDDVLAAHDTVCQIVAALDALLKSGQKPGIIGPVTNEINGPQRVEIGEYRDYNQMLDAAEAFHRSHHSSASEATQVRGLFWLMTPDCLSDVGGFDPRFGLGNFEDDDYNLRCRLAGYSLWVADGAFLHHQGSATFSETKIDYARNIERNLGLMLEKWEFSEIEQMLTCQKAPEGARLFIPLSAKPESSGHRVVIANEVVDLVHQATDMEFAAFVHAAIENRPREERLEILEILAQRARESERQAA